MGSPRRFGAAALFHGYASEKTSLLEHATRLRDLGFDVLLVDFRDSGGSSESHVTLGAEEADDVAAVFHWLSQRGSTLPILLYDQSMGAVAIVGAIAKHDISPAAIELESAFDSLLSITRNRLQRVGVPALPVAHWLVFWTRVHCGFADDPVSVAHKVTMPALLLHGEHDERVTIEQAQRFAERFGGRRELVSMPGASHATALADAPDAWLSAIASLVSRWPPVAVGAPALD